MSSTQATLGDSTPTLDADDLRQYIEDWKWSPQEVADEFGVTVDEVKDAIRAHDINYSKHVLGSKSSGAAKTLWEMDPDEFEDRYLGGESA